MSEVQVTPAAQWGRGKIETLPSGRAARLRAVDAAYFLRRGALPDAYTAIVAGATEDGTATPLSNADYVKTYCALRDDVVRAAFVEPRVAEGVPDEGEIALDDVETEDAEWVMARYNRLLALVSPFPQEQARAVPAEPGERDAAPAAE